MSFKTFQYITDPTPIAIISIFDKYLPGWYGWEPETIRSEMPEGASITDSNWSSIFACAATVNQARDEDKQWMPWEEADIFGDITQAFNGVEHNPEYWQKPQLGEIWYALNVLEFIDKSAEISDEVAAYIACCMVDRDIYFTPFDNKKVQKKVLEIIPMHVEKLSRESLDVWNDILSRKKAISRPENNQINNQILKVEAARISVARRMKEGTDQIRFVG